ncbi:hypothetical protein L596_002989 [Steinernema carpocapsae]|uniref:Uncharacterized protein n=1 Tax=Steinernema carpocapsae TaxID=34508 RepID=A0A4U8UUZ8_STECR|nr:hypothetical protein L596_002989 [Steinernema carpocapsae]
MRCGNSGNESELYVAVAAVANNRKEAEVTQSGLSVWRRPAPSRAGKVLLPNSATQGMTLGRDIHRVFLLWSFRRVLRRLQRSTATGSNSVSLHRGNGRSRLSSATESVRRVEGGESRVVSWSMCIYCRTQTVSGTHHLLLRKPWLGLVRSRTTMPVSSNSCKTRAMMNSDN